MAIENIERKRQYTHTWEPATSTKRAVLAGALCAWISLTSLSSAPGQFLRLADDINENGIPGAVVVVDPQTGQTTTVTDFDDLHEFSIPYPTFHEHQLPEPLAHFGRSQLQDLEADSFEHLLNNDATFSAWVQVPRGKAVELFRRVGFSGESTVGIASTAILGDSAASILNVPTSELPELFLFRSQFNPSNSVQPYRISIVGLREDGDENAGTSEWQHVALFNWSQMGIWTTYDPQGAISPLFSSAATVFNQPLFASGISVVTLDSPFPFWTAGQVGGQVGDLTVYPGLLSPGLVNQLAAHRPLAAPEPSSAWLLLSSLSIVSVAARRRKNAAKHRCR